MQIIDWMCVQIAREVHPDDRENVHFNHTLRNNAHRSDDRSPHFATTPSRIPSVLDSLLPLFAVHFVFGSSFLIDFLFLQRGTTHRLKQNGMQTVSLGHLDCYSILSCLSAYPSLSPPSTDSILFALSLQHCLPVFRTFPKHSYRTREQA